MAPYATLLCLVGIAGLFYLDRRERWGSSANFAPFIWLLIAMSRPVTSWTSSPANVGERGASYLEGSPIDRGLLMLLMFIAFVTLWRRREATVAIIRRNWPILLFLSYCLISISWTEFPMTSFKRWIRLVGDVMMILVIVTDSTPEMTFRMIVSRVGYLLVPISILFIRFFPELGRAYSVGGRAMWTGVCTDKNALGALCMIIGAIVLWRMLEMRGTKGGPERRGKLVVLWTMLLMVLYLLPLVDSKTAQMCFIFASVVVLFRGIFRRPWAIFSFTVGTVAACYAVLIMGVGDGEALEAIGRESSLTGRTRVWDQVLRQAKDPWIGTGFENFWLGQRLVTLATYGGNQAHNGYIEIYVNLGWVGEFFLGIMILAGYRAVVVASRVNPEMGRLKVAFYVICLVYNFSEAAFKIMSPVWLTFLWATMFLPAPQELPVAAPAKERPLPKRLTASPFAPAIRVKSV